MSFLDRARQWISAHPEPEIDASADAAVVMALGVFPGAQVVATDQPAVWPPAGSWLPTSSRTLDVYGTAAPTTECPCCGAMAWCRAGTGFTCGVCHPPPNTSPTGMTDTARDATLLRLAERTGFPKLALSPAVTVLAGQTAWRRFAALTTSPSLRAGALAALDGREVGQEG
jgi:hypothetical protein